MAIWNVNNVFLVSCYFYEANYQADEIPKQTIAMIETMIDEILEDVEPSRIFHSRLLKCSRCQCKITNKAMCQFTLCRICCYQAGNACSQHHRPETKKPCAVGRKKKNKFWYISKAKTAAPSS